VLLKLSGEVFGGAKGIGVDPDVVQDVARQIAARPASVSEFEIEETNSDPAATVPATPTPLRTWVVARTLIVRFWIAWVLCDFTS
jgi:hypothetical protein